MARIGRAPGAEGLDPAVALRRFGIVQTLAHRIAQLAAVIDQHRAERRVDLAAQLLEGLLRGAGASADQQQAFVHRIASAETFDGRRHRTLIRGLADAGERGRVTFDVELNTVGGVVEAAADKQVIRQHRTELALNAAGRLQDVVLATEQALRLGGC